MQLSSIFDFRVDELLQDEFLQMKAFGRYVLVVVVCFSLMGSCIGGGALCNHHHTSMMGNLHGDYSHAVSGHLHPLRIQESGVASLSQACCKNSSKEPTEYTRIFVMPDKSDTFRVSQIATFSVQILINCFELSEKSFITEISNTIDPTLASLRTVILLT